MFLIIEWERKIDFCNNASMGHSQSIISMVLAYSSLIYDQLTTLSFEIGNKTWDFQVYHIMQISSWIFRFMDVEDSERRFMVVCYYNILFFMCGLDFFYFLFIWMSRVAYYQYKG